MEALSRTQNDETTPSFDQREKPVHAPFGHDTDFEEVLRICGVYCLQDSGSLDIWINGKSQPPGNFGSEAEILGDDSPGPA